MSKDDQFVFSYSAKQQDEIKYIRDKYLKKEDGGISKIREIDRSVERKATLTAIVLGIIGILTFGGGLSMVMTTHGKIYFILGSIIGFAGIGIAFSAYLLFPKILTKLRQRYAPLIIQMCDKALENRLNN